MGFFVVFFQNLKTGWKVVSREEMSQARKFEGSRNMPSGKCKKKLQEEIDLILRETKTSDV